MELPRPSCPSTQVSSRIDPCSMRQVSLIALALATAVGAPVAVAQEAEPASPESAPGADPAADPETPAPDPPPVEVTEARRHFAQGLRLVQRERWGPALAEFEASLAQHPTRAARLNRGLCLYHLDRFMEALEALRDYLDRHGAEVDEAQRRRVRAMIDDVRGLLTEVEVRANVEGAVVLVDHAEVGTTPLARPLLLMSGPHDIEVRRAGYQSDQREVIVVAGRAVVETFELSEPRRRGRIRVDSSVPGATVLVSGREVGQTPWDGVLPAGPQEVEVRAHGYLPGLQLVTVEPGERIQAVVSLVPERSRAHPGWFWGTLALSAAASVATAALGATALSLDGSYDPDSADADQRYRQGRALMVGADVALGAALTSAAAALVLAFFTDWATGDE